MNFTIVSPFPPTKSGVADYSFRLCEELEARGHSVKRVGGPADLTGAENIIYMMGNNPFHSFVHDLLLKYPGSILFHDTFLYDYWRYRDYRTPYTEFMNRMSGLANKIYTHSYYGASLLSKNIDIDKLIVLPFPTKVRKISDFTKKSLKEFLSVKYKIPKFSSSKWVLVPGAIQPFKCPEVVLKAMMGVDATLIFAGEVLYGVNFEELKKTYKFYHTGYLPKGDWEAFMIAADAGVCLRKPPTNGETSAACFDLLSFGVPTVVFDTGSFDEIPNSIINKVRYSDNMENITSVINKSLNTNNPYLMYKWIEDKHSWDCLINRLTSN